MLNLFDNLPPAARATDPVTSKLAGAEVTESGERKQQAQLVADLVRKNPGFTSRELAAHTAQDRYVVARRLPDAEKMGLVRRGRANTCTVSGKLALTWFPVEM